MSGVLTVLDAGPAVSLQDFGRTGFIAKGLSRGGAMDRLALHEAAALLEQPITASIEMMGIGGTFTATRDVRIALTGAPMRATLDDTPLVWHASHLVPAGAKLRVAGVTSGAVGYVTVGGGIDLPPTMGSLSTHVAAGVGTPLAAGMELPLGTDTGARTGWHLPPADRFSGGEIRIVRSLQTAIFGEDTLARFIATGFTRDTRANRQGIRFNPDGKGFAAEGGLTVVSEIIAPGDIQITGDGAPYVLMCESQTTGGYPRMATVIPSDLPKVAQTPAGAQVRIKLLDMEDAITVEQKAAEEIRRLPSLCAPLIRDPASMSDLLSYTLTSGAVSATADPFEGDL